MHPQPKPSAGDEIGFVVAGHLRRLRRVLERHGNPIDIGELARRCGCDPEGAGSACTWTAYYALMEAVRQTGAIPGLYLQVGAEARLADLGLSGHAFLSSANLRQVVETAPRNWPILGIGQNYSQRIERGEFVFRIDHVPRYHSWHPFLTEELLASLWATFREMLPLLDRRRFSGIDLDFPAPEHAPMYARHFGCRVRFGRPAAEVRFPAAWLDIPFHTSHESAAEQYQRRCEQIVAELDHQGDCIDQVRRLLLLRPGDALPDLAAAARRLGLSGRTLRRRLHAAGTSYSAVVLEVRMELGREFLRSTELTVQDIGYLLGYAHTPSFTRAFCGHFGLAPSAWRAAVPTGPAPSPPPALSAGSRRPPRGR